jgi:hypothetical protein
LAFSAPEAASDELIVEGLLGLFGAIDRFGPHRSVTAAGAQATSDAGSQEYEAFAALTQVLLAMTGELRADERVRRAQLGVVLVRGVEQYLMLTVFLYLAAIIALRAVRRGAHERALAALKRRVEEIRSQDADQTSRVSRSKSAADLLGLAFPPSSADPASTDTIPRYVAGVVADMARSEKSAPRVADLRDVCALEAEAIQDSRWPINTALAALPALGFLGTVHGIMNALGDIDSIIRAAGVHQQAAAVTEVAGTLGLAFATTLYALTLGLILKVPNDYQVDRENRITAELERSLTPVLDPALWWESPEAS